MDLSSTAHEFDLGWLQDAEQIMMVTQDDELSVSSHSEATKLLEQWQTEDEEEIDIMEVDQQIGSEFLDGVIFDPVNSCASPVGPIEELILVGLEDVTENMFIPADDDTSWSASSSNSPSVEFGEQYKASLRKLSDSMKRSQETRMSLTLKTQKTEKYERSTSVSGVINSTEESSSQLRAYLANVQC